MRYEKHFYVFYGTFFNIDQKRKFIKNPLNYATKYILKNIFLEASKCVLFTTGTHSASGGHFGFTAKDKEGHVLSEGMFYM